MAAVSVRAATSSVSHAGAEASAADAGAAASALADSASAGAGIGASALVGVGADSVGVGDGGRIGATTRGLAHGTTRSGMIRGTTARGSGARHTTTRTMITLRLIRATTILLPTVPATTARPGRRQIRPTCIPIRSIRPMRTARLSRRNLVIPIASFL